jgi:hypothetical protein
LKWLHILPKLIINMAQTGVMLMIANNKTCNQEGTRQVDISGRDKEVGLHCLRSNHTKGWHTAISASLVQGV